VADEFIGENDRAISGLEGALPFTPKFVDGGDDAVTEEVLPDTIHGHGAPVSGVVWGWRSIGRARAGRFCCGLIGRARPGTSKSREESPRGKPSVRDARPSPRMRTSVSAMALAFTPRPCAAKPRAAGSVQSEEIALWLFHRPRGRAAESAAHRPPS